MATIYQNNFFSLDLLYLEKSLKYNICITKNVENEGRFFNKKIKCNNILVWFAVINITNFICFIIMDFLSALFEIILIISSVLISIK